MPIYRAAPLTEAVLEIRFTNALSQDFTDRIKARFQELYTYNDVVNRFELGFNIQNNPVNREMMDHHIVVNNTPSIRFFNDEFTDFLHLSPMSLVLSRLAPYPGWDVFVERFSIAFDEFEKVTGRIALARIGLRYVNRIDIPVTSNMIDESDYVNILIQAPDTIVPLGGYSLNIGRDFPDKQLRCILNSGVIPSPLLGHAAILLDIDVMRENNVPARKAAIMSVLSEMRELKDEIFESCITQKSREMFGG